MESSECAERPRERHSHSSLFVLLLRGSLAAAFLFFSLSSIGLKWAKVRMNPLKFTWSSLKAKQSMAPIKSMHWTPGSQKKWKKPNLFPNTFKNCQMFPRANTIKAKQRETPTIRITTALKNTQKWDINTTFKWPHWQKGQIPSALRWPHR